jgi:hypothetical protein
VLDSLRCADGREREYHRSYAATIGRPSLRQWTIPDRVTLPAPNYACLTPQPLDKATGAPRSTHGVQPPPPHQGIHTVQYLLAAQNCSDSRFVRRPAAGGQVTGQKKCPV